MVHAENHDMIRWIAKRLLERGHRAPKFHVRQRTTRSPRPRRRTASIALSRLLDVPVLIVHVSGTEAVQTIRAAQTLGAQRLRRDLPAVPLPDGRRHRPARPRGREVVLQPAAARRGVAGGDLGGARATARSRCFRPITRRTASTRRASCRKGDQTTFKDMANGVPGHRAAAAAALLRGRGQGPARRSTSSSR